MTIIYAIKDLNTDLFLAKDNSFKQLTTTTRTFKRIDRANEVCYRTPDLFFWITVYAWFKQYRTRAPIDSLQFNNHQKKLKDTLNLQVIAIEIKE